MSHTWGWGKESMSLSMCLRHDLCSLALRCKLEMSDFAMVAFEFLLNCFGPSIASLAIGFFFFIKDMLFLTYEWRRILFDFFLKNGSTRYYTFILLSTYILLQISIASDTLKNLWIHHFGIKTIICLQIWPEKLVMLEIHHTDIICYCSDHFQ